MANSEQSGSAGRDDWRVLIAGAVGGMVTGGLCMLVMSQVDFHGWGLIVFPATFMVGILLGQRIGSRLFRRPPGR